MKAMNLVFLTIFALFIGFAASSSTWYPEDVAEVMSTHQYKSMLQTGLKELCTKTTAHAAELGCPDIRLVGINAIDMQRVIGKKVRFNLDIANPQDEVTNVLVYVVQYPTDDFSFVSSVSFPGAISA